MSRPGMRFVVPGLDPGIKSAEDQAGLVVLRGRDLLVKQRTMLINAMRGHAAQFGVTAAKGPVRVAELVQRAHAEAAGVPAPALEMLSLLAGPLEAIESRLEALAAQLIGEANPISQCLATIPGVGGPGLDPGIGAVSCALPVPDPKAFRSGRLRGLARPDAARALDRRAPPARPDAARALDRRAPPGRRREPAWAARARRHRGDLLRQAAGQRSIRPHTKAGHMTAIDQTPPSCKNPCETGAVHTWVPACAGMTTTDRGGRIGSLRNCRPPG